MTTQLSSRMAATVVTAGLALGALTSGCGTLYDTKVTTIPGAVVRTNTVYLTNLVVDTSTPPTVVGTQTTYTTNVVALTNAATGAVTVQAQVTPRLSPVYGPPVMKQVITPQITYDYAPPTLVTNLVPRPAIESVIGATGAIPLPFAGTVAALLGWAYSFYASMRNKKVAAGLVMSVERAREFLQQTPDGQALDQKIKEILAAHHDSAGILTEVNKLLAQYVDRPGRT